MNRLTSITAGAVVAGMLIGGISYAQGPRGFGSGGRGPGGLVGGLGLPLQRLDLTEAQQQQVRDIRERNREQLQQASERLRQALDAQRQAVATLPVNEGLIRSTTQELADVQTEIAIQEAHVRSEVWGVLTPAQQAEAKKLQEERATRMEQRRQQMRSGGRTAADAK